MKDCPELHDYVRDIPKWNLERLMDTMTTCFLVHFTKETEKDKDQVAFVGIHVSNELIARRDMGELV